eukprot:CAMPEP_0175521036 /NCGR_PEP_ID=MMETSP0096-20121207/16816_1 /TAXON_ID=311494 /ORGANISM="Alexandrium monilatum, Strain CCMP3105" /LENGTH=51 /DNA_ID=CAMNT_0016823469 /DNA_START=439 /DNA_END=590 /DNA_ORIENTATION=-
MFARALAHTPAVRRGAARRGAALGGGRQCGEAWLRICAFMGEREDPWIVGR